MKPLNMFLYKQIYYMLKASVYTLVTLKESPEAIAQYISSAYYTDSWLFLTVDDIQGHSRDKQSIIIILSFL